jgi:hypothetical protein
MSAGRAWHGTRTSLVLLLAGVSGCGRLLDSRDVRKRSSAMVLIEPAEEIVYYDNHDPRGRPELEGISYLVSASYPAAEVICQITQHLASNGWQPLQRTQDDSATPSSYVQGWRVLISRRGSPDEHHVDLWDAEWVNDQGDLLSYSLAYRYPSGGPINRTRLRVGGIRQPAGTLSPADKARRATGGLVPARERPRLAPGEVVQCAPSPMN